jgi:hypothetical protein
MEDNKSNEVWYETEGVPTLYCNVANVTVSFSDLRLYLSEVSPKRVLVNPESSSTGALNTKAEALVAPKLSVVLNPEFAKSVGNAILAAVAKYESVFGPLRPEKTAAQVAAAIQEPLKK